MSDLALDHVVIHVDDWESCDAFYVGVLGLGRVENPEGAANPLGAWAFRAGAQQINVHGPWPGKTTPCCPPPHNEPGNAFLAFRSPWPVEECSDRLRANGITVEEGPIRRFGARGWGTSVYCRDPSGNEVELISYD